MQAPPFPPSPSARRWARKNTPNPEPVLEKGVAFGRYTDSMRLASGKAQKVVVDLISSIPVSELDAWVRSLFSSDERIVEILFAQDLETNRVVLSISGSDMTDITLPDGVFTV